MTLSKRKKRQLEKTIDWWVFMVFGVVVPVAALCFFVSRVMFANLVNPTIPSGAATNLTAINEKKDKKLSWLSTSGTQIVDQNKQAILLQGVNIPDFGWGGYNDEQKRALITAIDGWGANVVRVRIHEERYLADPVGYMNKFDTEVTNITRSKNVYVIIHTFMKDRVPLPDNQTAGMWAAIAARYKDDPTILYDPLDEPHDVDQMQVQQAYIDLIGRIRMENPRSLILVTGLDWGRDINVYAQNPLGMANLVYRTNPYNEPGDFGNVFGGVVGKLPVFFGEFGADAYPPMSRDAVTQLLSFAKDHNIGWTAWSMQPDACPCLISSYQTLQPTAYGEIIHQALLGPR